MLLFDSPLNHYHQLLSIRLVFHLSAWYFIFHQGGLSLVSGCSFIRVIFYLPGWSFTGVVLHQGGLSSMQEAWPQNSHCTYLPIQRGAPYAATPEASNQVFLLCIHDDGVHRLLVDKRFDQLTAHHVPQLKPTKTTTLGTGSRSQGTQAHQLSSEQVFDWHD